jgi:hypothetical protein
MNNIYKEKANKYKYKYLKLKQELEGGWGMSDPIFPDQKKIEKLEKLLKSCSENELINMLNPDGTVKVEYIGQLNRYIRECGDYDHKNNKTEIYQMKEKYTPMSIVPSRENPNLSLIKNPRTGNNLSIREILFGKVK